MAGRRKKQENLTLEQQLEAVTNEIAECEAVSYTHLTLPTNSLV